MHLFSKVVLKLTFVLLSTPHWGPLSAQAATNRIVVIGDSHSCGPFGQNLLDLLTKNRYFATVYCTESSAPKHWLLGEKPQGHSCQTFNSSNPKPELCRPDGGVPKLDTILRLHRGSKFIVALGTNALGSPKIDSNFRKMALDVRSAGESCVWVGAPHINPNEATVSKELKGKAKEAALTKQKLRLQSLEANVDSLFDSMADAVGPSCEVVDSRDATSHSTRGGKTADGVHRSADAAKSWVEQISLNLTRKLASPTRPSGGKGVSF